MKIIEPSVGLWKQGDDVKAHVAKCARVCYGKETGNDDVTINTLLKKHHWSMFRHESVYVIGEFTSRLAIALERYSNNPYINWTFHNNKLYIATNGNFCLDLKEQQEVNAHAQVLLTYINYYRVSEDTFFNNEIGYNMMRYTFCVILIGRYFNICYIKECQIKSGSYIPFNTIKLKGTKVEIKEFIAIMTIDCENSDLIRLSNLYDIDWKTNNTFKDKNIKDITVKDYNNYIKSISIVSNL